MNEHTPLNLPPLHLPEERDVPNPDAMFDAIMAAGASDRFEADDTREFGAIDELAERRRKRRWLAPIAVAAGLGMLAVGAGISHLMSNQQSPGPAQSPTVVPSSAAPSTGPSLPVNTKDPSTTPSASSDTPSASASSSAPSSPASSASSAPSSNSASSSSSAPQSQKPASFQFDQYGKATFRYVTVERTPIPSGYNAPIELEFVQGWYMTICVTSLPEGYPADGELAVGAGAFRSELVPDAQALNQVPAEGGHKPGYPPSGSKLKVGECATGFVSFDFGNYVDTPHDNMLLVYKNSWGETATWQMHN